MPRYLITTADERTWKFDRPVIFLGEWCRLYDRKHIWQDMDAIVAAPYGLGRAQKDADHAEARRLEEELFPILCDALNQHHGTRHDPRFWRIVLGHWLRRYVDVILNRVKALDQCLRAHQLSGTTAFDDKHYLLATMDSNAAVWTFTDDRWSGALYVRILNLLGVTNIPVEVLASEESEGFRWNPAAAKVSLKRQVLRWGYRQMGKLAAMAARESDAFLINSYLPKKEEIKLQLALGQVPQLWASPQLKTTIKPDRALRQRLSEQIARGTSDSLFGIMSALIFELLPVCYLEGFAELTETAQRLRWPKRPRFIFTSNNFDTDEVFKFWTATKIEFGFKYVTGQHGNNYGTYRHMHPSIEESTADKFLTWGWEDGLPQHTPAFILKTAGCKAETHNPNGGLLLIEDMRYQCLDTWDRAREFETYFVDQVTFVDRLQKTPRQCLTVRVHPAYIYLKSFDLARWRDFDQNIKIVAGEVSIRQLVSQSRLIVHGYDSTGILETLSQNIPTLAFWQNDFDHLRESAKPYYQLLVDAGIVHLSPESVAAKINEVWSDVEGWWAQSAVQEARKQFCNRYARVSQYPVRDLKKLLLQE